MPAFTNTWDAVLPRLQEALYGEFVISRELGRGGMAAVFLAHQLRLNRKVAIKVMAPSLMSGLGLVDRFRDEATTVARLDHPNIISIYEVGATNGLQYFIMQYVPGRSLERVAREYRVLPLDVARAILFEVGSALGYAHRHGVIHRDVKPGNILLSLDGRVIVSDFGIAKVTLSSVHTATGAIVGTPGYMSPEQCMGRPLTWSADQYSLGIVAYQMLTGAQPFIGAAYAVMRGHIDAPVPRIAELRPDCPPDVVAAIERMLAKNPADRFASMSEALMALGATRARIDDVVQAAIGHLATPLPDEEGIVLVHTPASPAPQQTRWRPHEVVPTPMPLPMPTPTTPPLPPPLPLPLPLPPVAKPNSRPRELPLAASARLSDGWRWLGRAATRVSHDTGTVLRLIQVLVIGAIQHARHSRGAFAVLASATVVALVATFAIVTSRSPVRSKTLEPPRPVRNTALGTTAAVRVDSARDSMPVAAADSGLPDSLVANSLVAEPDSGLPATVAIRRSRSTIALNDSVALVAIVTDLRGDTLPDYPVAWSVDSERVATIDAKGMLRARVAGRARVTARVSPEVVRTSTFTIVDRSQVRAAAPNADASPRLNHPVEAPARIVDEVAERDTVEGTMAAFVRRVILNKDTASIRRYYLTLSADDIAARDSLVAEIAANPKLTIKPPGSSPLPRIAAESATGRTKLTLYNGRQKKGTDVWISVELQRLASGWIVKGFRIDPKS